MSGNERYWTKRRRRVSRRRFLIGGGVAAAGSAALLAGCGGDPPAPAPAPVATESPTDTPQATPTSAATTPRPPTATPTTRLIEAHGDPFRYGGTLRLWKPASDDGLDPGFSYFSNKEILYPTLTQPMTYQPTKHLFAMDGMVGYEQVDPVTLVWSIRPEMRFHNGDPVDSEAVAFSFGRLPKLYEAVASPVPSFSFDFVDAFEATDVLTLTEHWNRPNADALVHRARHYYSFLNPRVVEEQGGEAGVYTAPDGSTEEMRLVQDLPLGVGSGPYTITKRDETGTRVERWPEYYIHAPAHDGFVEDGPYIDTWDTRILPDRDAAKEAFLAGELDVFDLIDPEELPEFEGLDHIAVTEIPNGGYSLLGMDGARFHDERARRALRMALDHEAFVAALRPSGGTYAAPISRLLPHFQKLTQEDLQGWFHHDPKEARALWEAAGMDLGDQPLTIAQGSDESSPQYAISEFVARTFHEVLGIRSEVSFWGFHGPCWGLRSLSTFGSCVYDHRDGDPKPYAIFSYGAGEYGGTAGLPSESHLIHYDPRAYGYNAFNFYAESPEPEIAAGSVALTEMLEAQEQELDFDARVELLTDIQRWILDRHWCNWALPVNRVSYYGFSSRLRDHTPEEWLNLYDLRRESMWLAEV